MAKKAREAFRTISEVADWLDVPAHVLRFWESKFQQIKPVKRAGGRRYYRPNDMLLIGGIKALLHDDGLTIRGVQKILKEEGIKHVAGFSQDIDAPADADAAQLRADERARRKQMGEDIRRRKPGITLKNREEIEDAQIAEDLPEANDKPAQVDGDLFGGDNVVPLSAEPPKQATEPTAKAKPETKAAPASTAAPKQAKAVPADPTDADIVLTKAQRKRLAIIADLRAVPREEHMLNDVDLLGPRKRLVELRKRLASALS